MRRFTLVSALVLIMHAATASAELTYDFGYSGRLADATGKPFEGPVALSFGFFRSATGGVPLLNITDGLGAVSLVDGIFQVKLTLAAGDYSQVFSDVSQPVYVQITDLTHAGTSPYPRQQISMIPYAAKVPVDNKTLGFNALGQLALLPGGTQAAGQFLTEDVSGKLVWATPAVGAGSAGTGANSLVQLDAGAKLPAVDGSQLTNVAAGTVGGVAAATIATAAATANAATSAGSASTLVKRDGSGNFSAGTVTANLAGNVTGNVSGSAGSVAAASVTGLTTGSVPFGAAGGLGQSNSSLFWDNPNSRLGIGTATPGTTLDVVAATNASITLSNGGIFHHATLKIDTAGGGGYMGDAGVGDLVVKTEAGKSILFSTTQNFSGGSDLAVHEGWVGVNNSLDVGTTSSTEKFEVGGGARIGMAPAVLTTVSGAHLATAPTIAVVSTAGYPASGTLLIQGEAVSYTGTTLSAFTGCTRGALGTTAVIYAGGETVSNYLGTFAASPVSPELVVTGAGSVGIGTAVPGATLDVSNPTAATTVMKLTSSFNNTAAGVRFIDTDSTSSQHSGFLKFIPSTTNNHNYFSLGDGASDFLSVRMDGNVGIGTSAPLANLHIVGGDSSTTYTKATIALGYSTTGQYPHFIHTRHNSAPTSNAIDFYTSDGTAAGVYPTNAVHGMTITNGAVGIGTTSPQTSLDVNGVARLKAFAVVPFACDAAHAGSISLTHLYVMCVCDGTAWYKTSDNITACAW